MKSERSKRVKTDWEAPHPFCCVYEEDNSIRDPDTRRDFIREVDVALKRQDLALASARRQPRVGGGRLGAPGVSMTLNRYDLPLESGNTMVTGVLLMPTPLCRNAAQQQDYWALPELLPILCEDLIIQRKAVCRPAFSSHWHHRVQPLTSCSVNSVSVYRS